MQDFKLGISEYEEVLYDNISKIIINRNYIKQNQQFWNNIVFKMFEEYNFSSEDVSIRKQARIVEVILAMMFKFKPAQELPEDLIEI